jgi:hypothetical protein
MNSLCYVSSSSLGLCACVYYEIVLCVCVASPNLTPCFLCDLYCKGERLQIMEIPRKREETLNKRLWYSSWSLDHLKGVEFNPRPLGRHNMEVGKCYLAEPRDKIACLLWLLSLWLFCPQELASQLLSRTNTSITKFRGYLVFNFIGSPIHPPSRCSQFGPFPLLALIAITFPFFFFLIKYGVTAFLSTFLM